MQTTPLKFRKEAMLTIILDFPLPIPAQKSTKDSNEENVSPSNKSFAFPN
jgi:hypothetical protein